MTRQEIISRIIELEMIVTEAVSKGHMAHTQDEYQPYREELKTLREINYLLCFHNRKVSDYSITLAGTACVFR